MNLAPVLRQRFFDANGLPLNGGLLYSYVANTSTPLATYSNATGTTNANPVVLDSSGYADVWLDPTLAYKFVLKDSSSVVQWTVDNASFASTGIAAWSANTIYQMGQIAADASGSGLLYVSLTNSNQNNALTSVSNWRIFGGNTRTVTANTTLAVTDEFIRSNSASGNLTHTLPACSTTPIGKRITIKDVGAAGNTTSVKGAGSDNVDGANTYASALKQYGAAMFENNGTSWDAYGIAADGSIVTAKLADNAVTTAKITDLNVTTAKIAAAAVTIAKIAAPIGTSSVFTSSGTYTVPAGANYVQVFLVGGGGGGGGAGDPGGGDQPGTGGGAGAVQTSPIIAVTPADTYTVTVGAAGALGGYGANGGKGGDSIFADHGVTFVAPGGIGGPAASNPNFGHTPLSGAGGSGSPGSSTTGGNGGRGWNGVQSAGTTGTPSAPAANSGAGGAGGGSAATNGGIGGATGYCKVTVIA